MLLRRCAFVLVVLLLGGLPLAARALDIPLQPFATFGFQGSGYSIGLDPTTSRNGQPALRLAANGPAAAEFAANDWSFDATPYYGKRVRLTAAVKTSGVETNASLWMRIDAPAVMAFDNMMNGNRGLTGDHDWTLLSVVLDVPAEATRIHTGGLLLAQHGTMWVAGPRLEVVPATVPVTGTALPRPTAAVNPPVPVAPHVLDAAQRAAVIAALHSAAVPLTTSDPGGATADLGPVERAIGDARIVGLGEATHGTSEFFSMKDRLLRDLVEKKGFTVFAIEAYQPEARAMENYVTTGVGEARVALAGLKFGVWQTTEVLALAQWIRDYNAAPGKHPVVHFAGFDVQSAQVARLAVVDFAKAHDPQTASAIEAAYACLPAALGLDTAALPAGCSEAVASVSGLLAKLAPDLDTMHDVRVVEQYAALFGSGADMGTVRDRAMAENIGWLAETKYPGAKIVVWAHNFHVSSTTLGSARSMGSFLDERYGHAYYRLGFAMDRGTVRASPAVNSRIMAQDLAAALPDSLEAVLREGGARYFLNLDALPPSPLRTWLDGGTLEREIGWMYSPAMDNAFYASTEVRKRFDGLIFIEETHAAHGL
jgi:erythromycin esterase